MNIFVLNIKGEKLLPVVCLGDLANDFVVIGAIFKDHRQKPPRIHWLIAMNPASRTNLQKMIFIIS